MKKINQILLISFLILMGGYIAEAATNNVKIKGRLVNSPCVILPENKNIEVDFGDIHLLNIYDPTYQLPRREITLVLSNCDISIAKKMKVKISGAEHGQMPGFLALSGVGSNPGLGIGFQLSSGEEIKINQVSPLIPITQAGTNELKFDTFLKATQGSIAEQQIKTGHISAIANILFEYE